MTKHLLRLERARHSHHPARSIGVCKDVTDNVPDRLDEVRRKAKLSVEHVDNDRRTGGTAGRAHS